MEAPRITLELQSQGYQISRITVAKYMKQLGLYSKLSKKFKVTTNSKHNHFVVPNILKREFTAVNRQRSGFQTSPIYRQRMDFYI